MSGYLGFDPTLVDLLRQAMDRALDELDSLRCTDHEADDAMRTIAAARSTLRNSWLPFTSSLLACRALTGYQPTTIDPGDVINSWLGGVAAQRHWQVLTDPLATAGLPMVVELTIDQARSLGAALSGPAGAEPLTAVEIAWLGAAVAEIGTRADLVAAFLPAMTTTGWTVVCNQLGTARRQLVTGATMYGGEITPTEAAGWAAIDAVFAGLGAIVVRNRFAHPESDASLLLDDMTAYSAALLVRQLDLEGDALARVSRELIEREQLEPDPYDSVHLGPRAADLLFDTMLATDAAPRAYVMRTLDAPQLVYAVADDQDLADRLVLAGTDHTAMRSDEASVAIPALVRWLLAASSDYRQFASSGQPAVELAQLIVPYLLPVLRSGSEGYGLSDAERRRIQMMITDDDRRCSSCSTSATGSGPAW